MTLLLISSPGLLSILFFLLSFYSVFFLFSFCSGCCQIRKSVSNSVCPLILNRLCVFTPKNHFFLSWSPRLLLLLFLEKRNISSFQEGRKLCRLLLLLFLLIGFWFFSHSHILCLSPSLLFCCLPLSYCQTVFLYFFLFFVSWGGSDKHLFVQMLSLSWLSSVPPVFKARRSTRRWISSRPDLLSIHLVPLLLFMFLLLFLLPCFFMCLPSKWAWFTRVFEGDQKTEPEEKQSQSYL